ncbi:MAG: hypothetical protein L0J77_14895, partial [Marinobacter sp.]|nr:hypothetical protein [Marinobacter sp.]
NDRLILYPRFWIVAAPQSPIRLGLFFLVLRFFRSNSGFRQKACSLDLLQIAPVCRECRYELVWFALFVGVVEHNNVALLYDNQCSPFGFSAPVGASGLGISLNSASREVQNFFDSENA